eukprot:1150569-Pelagomonas_calceolata.AAC.2
MQHTHLPPKQPCHEEQHRQQAIQQQRALAGTPCPHFCSQIRHFAHDLGKLGDEVCIELMT